MMEQTRILRNALGAFATGVTVVTTRSIDGEDVGRTANSFSSVSLDPPMILWSLSKSSSSFATYRDAEHFAVHILSADQKHLSGLFADKSQDKFRSVEISRGNDNIPLIDGCAARFECRTAYQYEGGDHIIFVGEVVNFQHSQTPPLAFHSGQYAHVVHHSDDGKPFTSKEFSLSPDDFIYLISRVFYRIRAEAVAERKRRGWDGPDYAVLTLLGHEDGRSVAELREIGQSRGDEVSNATILGLEQQGLLKLEKKAASGSRAFLTPEGRRAMIEMVALLKAAEAECLDSLEETEIRVMKQLLRRLASGDATRWPPYPSPSVLATAS